MVPDRLWIGAAKSDVMRHFCRHAGQTEVVPRAVKATVAGGDAGPCLDVREAPVQVPAYVFDQPRPSHRFVAWKPSSKIDARHANFENPAPSPFAHKAAKAPWGVTSHTNCDGIHGLNRDPTNEREETIRPNCRLKDRVGMGVNATGQSQFRVAVSAPGYFAPATRVQGVRISL